MNNQPTKRLYKSKDGAMLGGVIQGFSEVYNWDVSTARILFVLITFFVVGSPLIIYLILYLVLPDKQTVLQEQDPYNVDDNFYE